MALLISLVLGLIPLLGIVYILFFGSPFTVDGLFMSLILLSISGIVGLNVLIELRKGISAFAPSSGVLNMRPPGAAVSNGSHLKARGKVKDVVFFESNVGQPNKSIVTLSSNGSSQTLALEGDVRNALPVGQTLEITLRKEPGRNVLVDVNYA